MIVLRTAALPCLIAMTFAGCGERVQVDANAGEGEVVDSLAWFNDRVVERPNAPESYLVRGEFHARQGDAGAAIDDFARAISLDSSLVDARHELGLMRFEIQDFEGAVREWNGVLSTDANHIPSLLALAKVDLLLRSYDPAMQRINDALRLDDRLDEAYFLKGRLYLETGDTVTAASSFQTVVEVAPDRYDAYIQLGLLYAAAHDDLALEYFQTARTLKPNSIEAIYDQAMFLQENGTADRERYEQALDLYDEILVLDTANATAAFNKGFVHLEYLAQYDSAARWFGEAILRLPYYHQAHYNQGLALESMGDLDAALSAYNAALSFDPTYSPAAIAKGRVLEAKR